MFRYLVLLVLLCSAFSTFALDRTVVADSPEHVSPLMNGQFVPDVIVQTEQGGNISLQKLVENRPTMILFYRGGWCPYCNRQMAGIMEVEQQILDLGYQIVAISPDPPNRLAAQKTSQDFNIIRLSDSKLKAIRAFGLAYFVPDSSVKLYRDKLGAKLTTLDGSEKVVLPVPAAYIVETTGLVRFQYVNPNYRVRVEPQLLFYAARLAK